MALAFPSNPTNGQTYTYGDTTWAYNGRRWVKYIVSSNINVTPSIGGASVTTATVAPVTPSQGSLWLDTDAGELAVYQGTGWVGVGSSNAGTGYTGSVGPSGGYTGSAGSGYVGSVGYAGSAGALGYTGSRGQDGVIGYNGSTGYTGSSGLVGYTGSIGVGYAGSRGTDGVVGYNGSVGYTGSASTTVGYTGSSGAAASTPAIVSDQTNTSTGYFALPVGTTAQRGSPSAAGATRINSSTGYVEIYYNSVWNNAPINFAIGSTQANPGTSAAQIKTVSGTTTDGWYWINLPTVGSTYIYCDMNTNGGGWMLAAKLYSNANFNGYSSTDWTSISVFNELQTPTYAGNIKTNVYNYFTAVTGQRLSAGTVTNNLYEVWTGYSMYSLMNATSVNSQNSRTAWLNWQASAGSGIPVSNFDSQPNCNQAGTNKNYSHTVRIGISMNNENDCSSNDSSVGFGGSSVGYSGAASWTPSAATNFTGWIWVK